MCSGKTNVVALGFFCNIYPYSDRVHCNTSLFVMAVACWEPGCSVPDQTAGLFIDHNYVINVLLTTDNEDESATINYRKEPRWRS